MEGMITFRVNGKPEPAGSKRAFVIKGTNRAIVTDANAKSKPWKDSVLAAAIDAYKGAPLTGPLQLDVTFTLLRPKGHFGSGKNASQLKESAPKYPTGKPDVLKLTRGIEDAITGFIYVDDAQIVTEHIFKRYGAHQGAEISVAPYTEPEF